MRNVAFPDKEKIAEFCRHRHIRRLALFGSVLRDDFGPESDIDILVEFERGHVPGFFGLFKLEREFSLLFGVWKVDLRTPEDLNKRFRDRVVSEAEVICVRED